MGHEANDLVTLALALVRDEDLDPDDRRRRVRDAAGGDASLLARAHDAGRRQLLHRFDDPEDHVVKALALLREAEKKEA